jgi:hypothetical protein
VDSVEERMKSQKSTIRAVKKEQRETAKALAKEQEKLQKALDKAAAKVVKEAEKVRVKAEAKAERERLKAAKHLEKVMPVTTAILKMMTVDIERTEELSQEETCTSTSKEQAPLKTEESTLLVSTSPMEPSMSSPDTVTANTETPKQQPEVQSIISTVAVESSMFEFESETYTPTIKLPMEG